MTERLLQAVLLLVFGGCTNDFPAEILPGDSGNCEGLRDCLPGLSCCANRWIPGGTFDRGFDRAAMSIRDGVPEGTAPATVSPFRMDVFEVTVARFRRFVEAFDGPPAPGAGAHPRVTGSGWQSEWDELLPSRAELEAGPMDCDTTWTMSRDELPINCVNWYVAFAFCAWDGGRLPTEAEWNFVAAGGDEQRAYPWSDPPGNTMYEMDYTNYAVSDIIDDPLGVGSRSALDGGRFEIHDLAGNVREWVMDRALRDYIVPCVDCVDLEESPARIRRGGDHGADELRGRTGWRSEDFATDTSTFVGIRCVR